MDDRDPRQPANRRLILTAWLCTALTMLLFLAVVLGRLPALPTWLVGCVLLCVAGEASWRYRLRVRALRGVGMLRACLVAMLLALAMGFGLVHALPWIFENWGAGPWHRTPGPR
ncbi:MAG: hypothetical protein SFY96_03120 [Planctomycetota bacterium]|nr:hypothetical protein [Planctomycetota bacterium]